MVLGITLTIALETGIVISIDTLYDDFIFDNRNNNFTDINVIPHHWTNLSSLQALASNLSSINGVSTASPVFSINLRQDVEQSINNILIYAIDPQTHPDFYAFNLTAGERKLSENRIIVSQRLFEDSGLQLGDTVNTQDVDPRFASGMFTIGGVISNRYFFGNNIGYFFILVHIEDINSLISDIDKISILKGQIDLSVKNLLKIQSVSENIKDTLGSEFFVWKSKDITQIESLAVRSYQTAMNLVIITSFIVEFLFITNVLAIAIRDRTKEFGILRAIGTDTRQLIGTITLEITIISLVGGILGMVIGIGFAMVLVEAIQNFYTSINFEVFSLHSSSLLATFLSGIVVALISGLYPIFIALSLPVIQNIHSRMRTANLPATAFYSWKYSIVMGILLSITGFILQFFVGPSRFLDFEVLSLHFFVVLLIFIGTVLIEIGLLFFLPRLGLKVFIWFNLINRTISMRNIAREFQKSLITIMTSALALTFILIVGLLSASLVASVPVFFSDQWGSKIDLVVEAPDGTLSYEYTSVIENNSFVEHVSYIQESRTPIGGIDAYVFGVDPARYSSFGEDIRDSLFNLPSQDILALSNESAGLKYGIISDRLLTRLLLPLGSNVSLQTATSTINVTITAVVKSNVFLGNGEYLYISSNQFQSFFGSSFAKWFLCDIEGDSKEAQNFLRNSLPEVQNVMGIDYYIQAIEKSLQFQSVLFQVLFIESFVLAAIAQFVCILVSTLLLEREMGIMRSIGLSKNGVFNIFLAESMALGVTALFVGILDGILASILLAWYISLSFPLALTFPLVHIIFWIFVSFLITIVSTFLPSFRSSRKNIVSAILGRPLSKDYIVQSSKLPQSNQRNLITRFIPKSVLNASTNSKSVLYFISTHKYKVGNIFLLLFLVFSFLYIFDQTIIISGLNPLNIIWGVYIAFFSDNPIPLHQILNPILFILGLALIEPISYYLYHAEKKDDLLKEGVRILITTIILSYSLIAILILQFNIILLPIVDLLSITKSASAILYLVVLSFDIWIFQRIWGFLILQALVSETQLRQKYDLTIRKVFSKEMNFVNLLFIYFVIQFVLYILLGSPMLQVQSPVTFLLFSFWEIGFFMLAIIIQLVNIQNSSLISSK
ncbi:MAG: FtsX-like permease family protein [Candidatus Hodarchaeales archaeon]